MINEFAKIFVINDRQLLVMKEFDHDDDKFVLEVKIDTGGSYLSLSPKFAEEHDRDSAFTDFGDEQAAMFFKAMNKVLKEK